jgi:predicted GIY-YIG superfamily endonuclease
MNTYELIMSFFVYVLHCSDGTFYTGHTDDLNKRLYEHQTKINSCYTSSRLPINLIYYETFGSRDEAIAAEQQIKGWSRAKKQALVDGNFKQIKFLAKRPRRQEFILRGSLHSHLRTNGSDR